jgi:hypothetical protein
MLQAAEGGVEVHGAAPSGKIVVCYLREVLDVHGVPSGQVPLQLVHVGHDLQVPVGLGVAFPPAVDSLIGVHLDEAEILARARMDQEGVDISDFQALSPCR